LRIAIITSSYPRYDGDGTAPFVQSLTEAMRLRGHYLNVLAPYDIAVDDEYRQTCATSRFKYIWPRKWHILGHARSLEGDAKLKPMAVILLPLFLCSAMLHLLRITRKQSSEIIHAHWLLPNGLVAAWVAGIRKIPFIVSLHGSDMFVAGKNILFQGAAKYILKRASGVSACSQELMDRAVKLGAGPNIKLIPWGANPDQFFPLENKEEARTQLGWKKDEKIIFSLGRMVGKKGFNHLIAAFAELSQAHPSEGLKLVIGGEGPEKIALQVQAQQLGVAQLVRFPGRIAWDHVSKFLGAADIFVLPSVRDEHGNMDGLPTVLLEAMACGLPCIASDIGGVNLVIRNGENGILVQPGSAESLNQALANVLSDPVRARQLGEAARIDVVNKFNWKNVALEFERLINDACQLQQHPRLGQSYRNSILPVLETLPIVERALDLGCHDGSWLEKVSAKLKVGVDMSPIYNKNGVEMVKADITRLPFSPGSFGLVSSLDVLEHLEDPHQGIKEMIRVMERNGQMILTTPSDTIRLYPRCFTSFISKAWGHKFRRGFSKQQLESMFEQILIPEIKPWQAKAYRSQYLGLRILYKINKILALKLLQKVVKYDLQVPWGEHGYWLVTSTKKEIQ